MGAPAGRGYVASPDTLVRYLDWARRNAAGEKQIDIANTDGVDKATVSRGIAEAHRHVDEHTKAVMRGTILAGHLRAMGKLWDIVEAKHPVVSNGKVFDDLDDAAPVIAALREWRGQSERLARLFGLDAPTESHHTIEGEVTIDDARAAISRRMDELAGRRAQRALGGGHAV